MHGQGTYMYDDGSKCAPTNSPSDEPPHEGSLRFIGAYENGMKHGQGTYTFANGSKCAPSNTSSADPLTRTPQVRWRV